MAGVADGSTIGPPPGDVHVRNPARTGCSQTFFHDRHDQCHPLDASPSTVRRGLRGWRWRPVLVSTEWDRFPPAAMTRIPAPRRSVQPETRPMDWALPPALFPHFKTPIRWWIEQFSAYNILNTWLFIAFKIQHRVRICSMIRGPAMAPTLVTCPTRKNRGTAGFGQMHEPHGLPDLELTLPGWN